MLLYVMSEHPSISQTFVMTEASAVQRLGLPVLGYALAAGSSPHSPTDVAFVGPPPSRWQLAYAGLRGLPSILASLWRARNYRPSMRETLRLLLAEVHAAHVAAMPAAAAVTHIHAHFLGRASDVASAMASRLECQWTATSHGADAYAPSEPALFRRRLDGVAGVACANARVATALQKRRKDQSVVTRVVHCGVDLAALHFASGQPEPQRRENRLVTIGRLVPTKGHWTILEASKALMDRDQTLRWTVIGGGPLFDALRADPRARALQSRLEFIGPLDHGSALKLLERARAFVLPCEEDPHGGSDGIPVALMEAMALGVPVVTTPIGGIRELVVDRDTGLFARPTDAASVVRALEEILYEMDASTLDRLLWSARTKVEREFDATTEAAKLVEFLTELDPDLVRVPLLPLSTSRSPP